MKPSAAPFNLMRYCGLIIDDPALVAAMVYCFKRIELDEAYRAAKRERLRKSDG